jgi:hypothetical protein
MINNPFKNKAVAFDQRPWPLHNRYTRTDTFIRWKMAVTRAYGRYKFVTVSIPKRSRNGRFTSEVTWVLDPEVVKKIRWDF